MYTHTETATKESMKDGIQPGFVCIEIAEYHDDLGISVRTLDQSLSSPESESRLDIFRTIITIEFSFQSHCLCTTRLRETWREG